MYIYCTKKYVYTVKALLRFVHTSDISIIIATIAIVSVVTRVLQPIIFIIVNQYDVQTCKRYIKIEHGV